MFKCEFRAARGAVELYVYGEIGESPFGEGITARQVVEAIQSHRGARSIDVRINSEGGNAMEGFAIYNALRREGERRKVNTFVDGAALSAASVVMMAGDTIEAAENSIIMIHDPHSIVAGNAAELRERADVLDTVGDQIADTYAGRATSTTAAQFRRMMRNETWLKPADAAALGLVDVVGTPLDIAASFHKERWQNVPAWAIDQAATGAAFTRQRLAGARATIERVL